MLLKGAYCVGEHFVDPHGLFKNPLYVSGIFQYHVTHGVSVYAIHKRNGVYSLPVLIC